MLQTGLTQDSRSPSLPALLGGDYDDINPSAGHGPGALVPADVAMAVCDAAARDPQGRLIDPRIDWYIDPKTGYYTDPATGLTIDPKTQQIVRTR